MNRRGFLCGLIAAPLVVHSGVLMPVKALDMPMPRIPGIWGRRNGVWRDVRDQALLPDGSISVPWERAGIDCFGVVVAPDRYFRTAHEANDQRLQVVSRQDLAWRGLHG